MTERTNENVISVRIDAETDEAIMEHAFRLSDLAPGVVIRKSDAVRSLIKRGLEAESEAK